MEGGNTVIRASGGGARKESWIVVNWKQVSSGFYANKLRKRDCWACVLSPSACALLLRVCRAMVIAVDLRMCWTVRVSVCWTPHMIWCSHVKSPRLSVKSIKIIRVIRRDYSSSKSREMVNWLFCVFDRMVVNLSAANLNAYRNKLSIFFSTSSTDL